MNWNKLKPKLKIKSKKKARHLAVVLLLAVLFFLGTAGYNYYVHSYSRVENEPDFVKWASPDETANYIFSKLYSQTGNLVISENYNLYTKDIMHPRSFRSDLGELKPVSFLGIILIFGRLAALTTYKIIPFLTPIFAGLGIIYFYYLIKALFGRSNAIISASLLAILPPYLYYSSRSMFHNVLFVVLLIISIYYLVIMVKSTSPKTRFSKSKAGQLFADFFKTRKSFKTEWRSWLYGALGGFFLGLALITRTAELLWLGPLLVFLWLFHIKKIGLARLVIVISFCGLAMLPSIYYNQVLYGSFIKGGYSEMNQSIANISSAGAGFFSLTDNGLAINYKELSASLRDNIFHFGFHPRHSLQMGQEYFVKMFNWLFWPAVAGLVLMLFRWRKIKRRHWLYFASYFILSGFLLVYYGSWEFHDNPDPNSFTIGNSYTRYWLPIYIGAIPLASYFLMRLTIALRSLFYRLKKEKGIKDKFLSWGLRKNYLLASMRVFAIVIVGFVSVTFVLYGSEEGLVYQAGRHHAAKQEWHKVLALTESNSTVITRYHDKLFFPERKVIVGLFDDKRMIDEYANLAALLPVYYYNFTLPEKDFNYLNDRRLAEQGLGLEKIEQITDAFTLYKFYLIEEEITSLPEKNELESPLEEDASLL